MAGGSQPGCVHIGCAWHSQACGQRAEKRQRRADADGAGGQGHSFLQEPTVCSRCKHRAAPAGCGCGGGGGRLGRGEGGAGGGGAGGGGSSGGGGLRSRCGGRGGGGEGAPSSLGGAGAGGEATGGGREGGAEGACPGLGGLGGGGTGDGGGGLQRGSRRTGAFQRGAQVHALLLLQGRVGQPEEHSAASSWACCYQLSMRSAGNHCWNPVGVQLKN